MLVETTPEIADYQKRGPDRLVVKISSRPKSSHGLPAYEILELGLDIKKNDSVFVYRQLKKSTPASGP